MTQVAVGSQIFNYEEMGEGNRTPLLILHGWGRSGTEWINLSQELSLWSGRKAYILDLPGFGGSSLPTVAGIEEYSQLVKKLLDYLELKTVVLIGHSLGGRVGIVLAAKEKSRIEKLILLDPAGVKPRSFKRVLLKALAKLFAWVPGKLKRLVLNQVMDEDYRNSLQLRELYRSIVRQDLKKYLPQISCETRIIWGEQDPILPLYLTKIYRKLIKHSSVRVVWGAKHDPQQSHYEQTLKILQECVE
jgi:pimeloyl-ACP methyl ester carboxylesterase